MTTEATVLRGRAAELRRVAHAIEATPAIGLAWQSGDDTWSGNRPHHCVTTLAGHTTALLDAAAGLRADAHRFELRANHLDIAAAGPGGPR